MKDHLKCFYYKIIIIEVIYIYNFYKLGHKNISDTKVTFMASLN